MRKIARKKKKSTRKWNRTHFFQNERKDPDTRGKFREHPALIFEKSGDLYKAIIFTKDPPSDSTKYKKLKYNVDPNSSEDCYGMHHKTPRPRSDFQPPKINYRVHKEDLNTIRMLKKPNKNKK